jgi:hypothetical protein
MGSLSDLNDIAWLILFDPALRWQKMESRRNEKTTVIC